MELQVTYKDRVMMRFDTDAFQDGTPLSILIPPFLQTISAEVPGVANAKEEFLEEMLLFFEELSKGVLYMDTHGFLDLRVGEDIMLTLPYAREQVPVCPFTRRRNAG